MGVLPCPAVVRAKGFLTGDVTTVCDWSPNGSVFDGSIDRQPKRLPRSHHLSVVSLGT
jgi:hypothetical protein